ncbi:SdiA-regulated domain-containing protein [Stutzerimonas azotifigens]|uniref:SdiA-regulated domain-containing protein n=1 Tax=Stutzerimonas azotifigens TaxID=291995 RepID=A0ABR5YZ83_9GAMM|nr:SdiA-regulated domain-containing protein [Stutzerimonas azotifigens]MBA1273253.1 SdiA-regulated domain-containing protein [Stutzerimonas azotifigens]
MPRRSKGLLILLVAAALLLAVAAGQHYRFFEQSWFEFRQWQHASQWKDRSVWLRDYQAAIQGKAIEGIDDDLSALTFNPDRNTLVAVTNANSRWLELSLDGELLREIPMEGFGDPEAIEYVAPGLYVISDERTQQLLLVRIGDETRVIDAAGAQQLSLAIDRNGNKGFEGLAYDSKGQRLFVAKERDPVRIYEIEGFPQTGTGQVLDVKVSEDAERDARLFVRDLSSLHYDEKYDHMLVLSDESRMVVELDKEGHPISQLLLRAGAHGLDDTVPQAEGMTMGPDGTLYLVSEPNLFYTFVRGGKAP